jgi:multisubunit Na+/H+ antiporter MnhG subunit
VTLAAHVLLAAAVLAVWLGCIGFARLSSALDRLHCATFVAVAAGPAILLAGFLTEGGAASVVKVLFLLGCFLLSGAALSHAIARAVTWRDREGAEP